MALMARIAQPGEVVVTKAPPASAMVARNSSRQVKKFAENFQQTLELTP